VAVFALGISGVSLFYVFNDLHNRYAVEKVHKAFTMLEYELTSQADSILNHTRTIANRNDIIALMNTISEYQSAEAYPSLLFDVEKKKVAEEMAERAENSHVELIAVYDVSKMLSAFIIKEKRELWKGVISFNQEAQPVIYTSAWNGGDQWIKSALPPVLELTIADIPKYDTVIYRKSEHGFRMEVFAPIIRNLPDGTLKTAGFIKLSHKIDINFIVAMSQKFGMNFHCFIDGEKGVGTFKKMEFSEAIRNAYPLFGEGQGENIVWIEHEDYFLHAHFIPLEGGTKVWFVLGSEKKLLTAAISRTAMILVGVLLFSAFIVILAGSFIANRMITTPVLRLAEAVKAFKEGRYKESEAINAHDEIGMLTQSFGDMALTIQRRGKEIENYRDHLEDMIEKRTKVLDRQVAERKKTEKALQKYNKYMEALHEISLGLITRRNVSELLEAITTHITGLVDSLHGFIFIYDPDTDELELRVGHGRFKKAVGFRLKHGEGLAWQVWETGRPAVMEDYNAWEGKISGDLLEKLRACIIVPMKSGAGTIGLGYFDEDTRHFEADEIEILTRFAELASIVLENAKLWEELQHAKNAAESASRSKSAFLRNISHELRTPLTAIMGYSELMSGNPALAPEHQKQAATIHSKGEHLLSLINRVIELTRDEVGDDQNQQNLKLDDLFWNIQAKSTVKYDRLEKDAITSRLQSLPPEQTEALRNAAEKTSPQATHTAIRQIEKRDAWLAKALAGLVGKYRFDIIQELLEEV